MFLSILIVLNVIGAVIGSLLYGLHKLRAGYWVQIINGLLMFTSNSILGCRPGQHALFLQCLLAIWFLFTAIIGLKRLTRGK